MLGVLLALAGTLLLAIVVLALIPLAVVGFSLLARAVLFVVRGLGIILQFALAAGALYIGGYVAFAVIRNDPVWGTFGVLLFAAVLWAMYQHEMRKLESDERNEEQLRLEQARLSHQRSVVYDPANAEITDLGDDDGFDR